MKAAYPAFRTDPPGACAGSALLTVSRITVTRHCKRATDSLRCDSKCRAPPGYNRIEIGV